MYPFQDLDVNSFLRAKLEENRSCQMDIIVNIILQTFLEYDKFGYSTVSWGILGHMMHLDQLHASENIQ